MLPLPLIVWWDEHSHLFYVAWCVAFGATMLAWPFILLATGINVFTSGWYWLSLVF